jgi:uncharacterized protein YbbC (DUF1343 family)/CubicO group peptidase (beta-lactamase class C family)
MLICRFFAVTACCLLPAACYSADFDAIRPAVEASIRRGDLPGAVVAVLHDGKVVCREAIGQRALQPEPESMTVDTVFDMASVTKPVATATSAMILIEQGKLKLDEPVATYWPEFGANGKEKITIENLMLHTSGLMADNPVSDYADGPQKALERICQLKPQTPVGSAFKYSDVNFIVLGGLVGRVAGMPLDKFAKRNIFGPLGMTHSGYRPAESVRASCAPTEQREGHWMRGEVHDPRAYALGGVAGHAGLFSTADDLLIYARMILDGGRAAPGKQIMKPETVKLMTTPRPVPGGQRALGWDVDTSYSKNRGSLFPRGKSFGHTGFTGTSIWIDPSSRTAVIFLSNRVHPDGKGQINRLRGRVASVVAASIVAAPFPARKPITPVGPGPRGPASVRTGIDVLARDGFRALKGRRVGLVTNHTGVDLGGRSTIDRLHGADGVKLVALFSPEHGIRGAVDRPVPDGKDEKTGLPVYSLYGARKRPTPEQLRGLDTLVYDIQDIGCRFYTYETTLGHVLETAAAHKLKVVVLDRPNPIDGVTVEGPVLDAKLESFTGYHALPLRHGLTVGELARLFNRERKIGADLEVIPVQGWQRADLYDRTGLLWVNPSPNMRTLAAALLYPGVGLLETTNVSVGRGTDRPFEVFGAPWLDGRRLAAALTDARLPGVRFVPVRFTPASSTHAGKECGGVQIFIDDWRQFRALPVGLAIACQLRRLYPEQWQMKGYGRLLAHPSTLEALERDDSPEQIMKLWQPELERFREVRKAYLLY